MELKLIHFLIVMAIAVSADVLLTKFDHLVEAMADDEVEPVWTHHHPIVAAEMGGHYVH